MPAPAPHALLPVLAALGPVFGLITLGYGRRRSGCPGPGFWQPAERLSYYLPLPALLGRELARADFGALAVVGGVGAHLVQLPPLETAVVVLFAALPGAPAYLLARQMGADAPFAAVLITVETLAAMATLPLVVLLAGGPLA